MLPASPVSSFLIEQKQFVKLKHKFMKKNRLGVFPFRESVLKIIRVMKLVSFLLLAAFLQVSAKSYSQTTHIKLSLQTFL